MSQDTSPADEPVTMLMARVYALVHACPVGKVTTYGWLASAVGYPRGARMVGWFMNEVTGGIPAQRVINSKGELSGSWAFGSPERMRLLLEAEGVHFTAEGKVDLKRYGWNPLRDLGEAEREQILANADSSAVKPSARLEGLLRYDAASPFKQQATDI